MGKNNLSTFGTDILKVDFFCVVKTSVSKFCARKNAKITPKVTLYV